MNRNQPAVADVAPLEFRPAETLVSEEQKLELLEYWRSITKRKWPILGLMLAAAVLAAALAFGMTPIYKSTATLLIEAGRAKIVSFEDVYAMGAGQSREGYLTQVEVIKSRDVVERAVRAEKVWLHTAYDPRKVSPSISTRLLDGLGLGSTTPEWTEDRLVAYAVMLAQSQMSVEAVGYSQLIRVSFESPDMGLAARMANAIAQGYISSQRDARTQSAQSANATLLDNLGQLKEKLAESERALQQYRESRGIVSLSGSAQTLAGQQAEAATESLISARSRRLELEGAFRQLSNITDGDYSSIPSIARDLSVSNTQVQLSETRRRLAELSQTLGTRNNKVLEVEAQVDSLLATLKRQSAAAGDALKREYQAALATEQSLERALGTVRDTVKDVNRDEFQLAALEREVATNRQLYDMFMTRAKETNLAGEVQADVARIVERAVMESTPIKPKKPRIIGLAIAAAALLGALIALTLDLLDNTIKGGDDAESRLRLPLLTALPALTQHDQAQMAHLFLQEPDSHYAEAIRTARTGVLLSNIDRQQKTLLVTSTVPGEGKTTVSINLALAHAQTHRTLLIDADMRRPQVAPRLGIPARAKGLSNLIAGDAQLDECLHSVFESRLKILPVGDLPPNPLELLLSRRFDQVLGEMAAKFDIVIIDSPPVGLVSEAQVLAPKATSTLLVVRAMVTPTPMVRKSISRLQRAGGQLLGVVLNGLDFQKAEKYYGQYGEGYGYGYGEGEKSGYGYSRKVRDSGPEIKPTSQQGAG